MADLFFYGSLLDKDVFEGISGLKRDKVRTTAAIREGFACTGMLNWPYPMLVQQQNAKLSGIVFHDIEDPALSRIKFYEGDEYELVEVDLIANGQAMKAFVFEGSQNEVSDGKAWSFERWQADEKPRTMKIIELMMPKFDSLDYAEFNRQWDELEAKL